MIDSKTALDAAIEATPPEIRVVLAVLIERLGGCDDLVRVDHEDVARLVGRRLAYECERGTIRLGVVDAKP